VENKTIDDVREQILGEFDNLRKEGKKHTAARQSVMDRWGSSDGWSVNKVYNLIRNERPTVKSGPFARTKKVKPTPKGGAAKSPVVNLQDEINSLHSEIMGFAKKTLDHAIRIGELLTAKKDELDHGEWLPWLKKHVNFGPDAAERYRVMYARREELPLDKVKTLTQALKLLKKSNDLVIPPDPVKRAPNNPDEKKLEAEALEKEKQQLLQNLGVVEPEPSRQEPEDAYDEAVNSETGEVFQDEDGKKVRKYTMTPEELAAANKEASAEALETEGGKILDGIWSLLEECHYWEKEDYHAFLMELVERLRDEIEAYK
jgi:hypothetical protein